MPSRSTARACQPIKTCACVSTVTSMQVELSTQPTAFSVTFINKDKYVRHAPCASDHVVFYKFGYYYYYYYHHHHHHHRHLFAQNITATMSDCKKTVGRDNGATLSCCNNCPYKLSLDNVNTEKLLVIHLNSRKSILFICRIKPESDDGRLRVML